MLRSLLLATALFILPHALADEPKPIEAFNAKDLTGWKLKNEKKSHWKVCAVQMHPDKEKEFQEVPLATGKPYLSNIGHGGTDIFTEAKFGDVTVELECMIPKGSNSGIYLNGEYEVQIIDSFGEPDDKLGPGDHGGIYTASKPKKNMAKKPGEWQKFLIEFQAPKFEGDKKVANAKFLKVTLNDEVIQENVEVKGSTGGGLTGKDVATGPLMFQGDHGPVTFRNIKITPRE